jgi:hypothetical protein
VFAASLCYAKITPAALHCGGFDDRRRRRAEALARKTKFELSNSWGVVACQAPAAVKTLLMAPS